MLTSCSIASQCSHSIDDISLSTQKAIYFINLVALLGAQIYVTVRQGNGDYQCKSITVRFKDEVWEKSLVQMPGEEMKEMALVYPYFNGIYNQDGTSNDGRPV